MFKNYIRYLFIILVFVFSTSVFALDYAKLPEIVKTNITKQYSGQKIKILSVKKTGEKFSIIIKTKNGKDKVIVTKKGKILSISDYLEGMEATGGC